MIAVGITEVKLVQDNKKHRFNKIRGSFVVEIGYFAAKPSKFVEDSRIKGKFEKVMLLHVIQCVL